MALADFEDFRGYLPGMSADEMWAWIPPTITASDFPDLQLYIEYRVRLFKQKCRSMSGEELTNQINLLYETPTVGDKLTDRNLWAYKHLRALVVEIQQFVCQLEDICTYQTCKEMKATDEWQFLCASHHKPQACCAIDYMTHTLDTSISVLNSKQFFSDDNLSEESYKLIQQIARRLYRVFAHIYFNHQEQFRDFENETLLHERYKQFSVQFNLVPNANFIENLKSKKADNISMTTSQLPPKMKH
ncbi:putative 40S ribosomal protein S29 [Blattamonas nauphoetae]|uniref:40S ribosomal protein S29 n=1 Tax=Blattamonas nauphoetae TaxID=2049346 RepID=A0ABQ9XXS0_9EUKA|nr:putative 40S ribosomal protein S29 [Blattamonas nauphoetae]